MTETTKCFICHANADIKTTENCSIVNCDECGRYNINTFDNKPDFSKHDKLVLKHYYTKLDADDSRRFTILNNDNLKEIIEGVDYPKNLVDKVHGVLKYFVEQTTFYSQSIVLYEKLACRLLFCVDARELRSIIKYLCEKNFLDNMTSNIGDGSVFQLRMEGLQYYQEIIVPKLKFQQCFVAMWFNNKEDKENFRPNMQKIYTDVIKPAIENDNKFTALKIDSKEHCNDINDEMIAQIRKSRFMIADLTGYRGGVYFEAGFAHGLGIPVIYTCHKKWLHTNSDKGIEGVHFDINHRNIILWDDENLDDFKTRLSNRINAIIV